MRDWLGRMQNIDRRWIFLAIFLAVLLPFVTNLKLPVGEPSPATRALYDHIEQLPEGSVIVISCDYSPSSMPELEPMAKAIVRHALQHNIRVVAMTLHPQGALMIDRIFDEVAPQVGAEYGEDYVVAGFKPGGLAVILGMGRDIPKVFGFTDARGNELSELPAMEGVNTYDDVAVLVDFAANNLPQSWVAYAHERYDLTVAAGVTGVMATDLYPFWKSGQLLAVVNGLKGAAEYEHLVGEPGWGLLGMSSQSIAHALIILFVIFGNVGYFLTRRS
ncbi:MAG: hypothetical protein R6V19_10245 [Armatimonadota bacterium]